MVIYILRWCRYLDLFAVSDQSAIERTALVTHSSFAVAAQSPDSVGELVLEAETTQSQIGLFHWSFEHVLLAHPFLEAQHLPLQLATSIKPISKTDQASKNTKNETRPISHSPSIDCRLLVPLLQKVGHSLMNPRFFIAVIVMIATGLFLL